MFAGIFGARVERPIAATVSNFVASYHAVSSAGAPMSVWERFVYSIALSKQRAPEKKCAMNFVTHIY